MEIFDIIKSVIFGIVEGITEWLPISSTGHMILLNESVSSLLAVSSNELPRMGAQGEPRHGRRVSTVLSGIEALKA